MCMMSGKTLSISYFPNNGFKVINVGIKTDLETYLEAEKEFSAQAIGMSGTAGKIHSSNERQS